MDWQPIETAPKNGAYILLLVQDIYGAKDEGGARRKPVLSYWDNQQDVAPAFKRPAYWGGVGTHWRPTHWLQIPDAPPLAAA